MNINRLNYNFHYNSKPLYFSLHKYNKEVYLYLVSANDQGTRSQYELLRWKHLNKTHSTVSETHYIQCYFENKKIRFVDKSSAVKILVSLTNESRLYIDAHGEKIDSHVISTGEDDIKISTIAKLLDKRCKHKSLRKKNAPPPIFKNFIINMLCGWEKWPYCEGFA